MIAEEVLAEAATLAARREEYALATVVWRRPPSSAKPGAKALVMRDGSLIGWIGGSCTAPAVVREAVRALEEGTPRLLHLAPTDELPPQRDGVVLASLTCASEGALEVFIEPHTHRPHLVLIGSAPAAHALAAMAAALDFDVMAIDPADPADLGPDLRAAGVGPSTFVVVATLDRYDETALEEALVMEAPYIALVSSRKRAASVLRSLRDSGVAEENLKRVRAPAGLDLGPLPHREIAVAILAEIVQLKAAGVAAPGVAAAADQETALEAPKEAVDPVCGMTVEVATARFTTEQDGQTYYFCRDGCRRRFGSEPARYMTTGG